MLLFFLLSSCGTVADRQGAGLEQRYEQLLQEQRANLTDPELQRQLALVLAGSFGFDEHGEPARSVGLDRPIEAYRRYYGDREASYRALRPEMQKFSLAWYRFLWESYWFARRAAEQDPTFLSIPGKFYRIARSTDDFAHLRAMGDDGEYIYRCFQANR